MSIVHEPTFKLDRTHAFTAFSMCTIGTKDPIQNGFKDRTTASPLGYDEQSHFVYKQENNCYNEPDPWKWMTGIIRQEVRSSSSCVRERQRSRL